MKKVQNIVFIAVCFILFSIVIGYKVAENIGVLPESLSNGTISHVESRYLQTLPELSLENVVAGEFQSQAETYLADRFPCKEEVLLTNAKIQRTFIEAANIPFGFEVYPSFYDSKRLYSPRYNALFIMPENEANAENKQKLLEMSRAIRTLDEQTNCNIVVFVLESSRYSDQNPVANLVTNKENMAFYETHLFGPLRNEGVTIVSCPLESTDMWLQYYYSTDHHWNIYGAYEAYKAIMKPLGYKPFETGRQTTLDGYIFRGSNANIGLDFIESADCIVDFELCQREYLITQQGVPIERNERDSILQGSFSSAYVSYGNYYGMNLGYPAVYHQAEGLSTDKKLLLITDSFGNAIELMLASHYVEMHVIHPIDLIDETNLEDYLAANSIDDIVIMPTSYGYLTDGFREFFSPYMG